MELDIGYDYWLDRPTISNYMRNVQHLDMTHNRPPIKGRLIRLNWDRKQDYYDTVGIRPLNINGMIIGKIINVPKEALLRKVDTKNE